MKKIKESFPMVLINSIIGKLLLVFAYLITANCRLQTLCLFLEQPIQDIVG
ncbi:MAG: hypothetical protein MSA85_03690 [Prevotella sp.]|uniref:Uncharacterized protein n=1 Tax=Hallella faecis TaxID=2841596 RepID=A0ABV1FPI9_9BACT|nr:MULTISPECIES: hypothetical protein [Hallella]MCI7433569.1 hypothetical protein [Prevotella sp.]MBU0289444.1 hypothetical protein [Hallella faecis]MDR4000367.1 hypothetical protein [Hallella sp.]MDY5926097.1 hypothetical protein [Hallella sp.]MED9945891.1 hypothetical protein [Hallella sp.]